MKIKKLIVVLLLVSMLICMVSDKVYATEVTDKNVESTTVSDYVDVSEEENITTNVTETKDESIVEVESNNDVILQTNEDLGVIEENYNSDNLVSEDGITMSDEDNIKNDDIINFDEEFECQIANYKIGNSINNILAGGVKFEFEKEYFNVEDDNLVYYDIPDSEKNDLVRTVLVKDRDIKNINILGSIVYYTAEGRCKLYDTNSKEIEVITPLQQYKIKMMYIVDDMYIYFMVNNTVYVYDIDSYEVKEVDSCDNAQSFIPTNYGIIFIKKKNDKYCLNVNNKDVISEIEDVFRSDNIYLYYFKENEIEYVNDEKDLFNLEDNESADEENKLEATENAECYDKLEYVDNENVDVDIKKNENNDLEERTSEDEELVVGDCPYSELRIEISRLFNENIEVIENDEILEEHKDNNVKKLSKGVQNCLDRAWQVYNNRWTPVKNLSTGPCFRSREFIKGKIYEGVPYGQPYSVGGYICHNISLKKFNEVAKDRNSNLYTKKEPRNNGLYYALDCSAYVSYCFGLPRMTTASIASRRDLFTYKDKLSFTEIEIGDVFNRTSRGHVILVVDVKGDYIYTLEQTIPSTKYKKIHKNKLSSEIYNQGYRVYRYNKINTVPPVNGDGNSVQAQVMSTHVVNTLSYGDKNIASYQKWLNEKYNFNISVDGCYGKETKRAIIKGWQIQMNKTFNCGLVVDGGFGSACYKAAMENGFKLQRDKKRAFTKIVQGLLKYEFKYSGIKDDGIYNDNVKKYITKFQKSRRLNITEKLSADTWYALFNNGRILNSTSYNVTSTRNNIKTYQKWLNKHFSNIIGEKLVIDGNYGPKTKLAAIKSWQYSVNKYYGTKLVLDGCFGPKCISAANKIVLKGNEKNRFVAMCEALLNVADIYTKYKNVYDNNLKNKVIKFQGKNKLKKDGYCGPMTWNKLFNQ